MAAGPRQPLREPVFVGGHLAFGISLLVWHLLLRQLAEFGLVYDRKSSPGAAVAMLGRTINQGGPMATKELRELRHRYKAAYTSYLHCVQALSDSSQRGEWPSADLLRLEEQALHELNFVRRSLLDALYAHSIQGQSSKAG